MPPSRSVRQLRRAAAAALLTAGALAGLAACADAPSSPATAAATRAPSLSTTTTTMSGVISEREVGDTTIVEFVLGTNTNAGASIEFGHGDRINFPYAVASVCDPATSSYGPTEWDAPCTAATRPIRITVRRWLDRAGRPNTDFQPRLRFVPALSKHVMLYLHDCKNQLASNTFVAFCTSGTCIDEANTDPSVATQRDVKNKFWVRRVKHFSGYNVIAE